MKAISFGLERITTEQFATVDNAYKKGQPITIETEFKAGVAKPERMVGIFMAFKFECAEKLFMVLEVACHFKIKQESWKSFESSKPHKVPVDFMRHLGMITIGTARGVLHAKTENTKYNKFPIPLINVEEMIKNDSTF